METGTGQCSDLRLGGEWRREEGRREEGRGEEGRGEEWRERKKGGKGDRDRWRLPFCSDERGSVTERR